MNIMHNSTSNRRYHIVLEEEYYVNETYRYVLWWLWEIDQPRQIYMWNLEIWSQIILIKRHEYNAQEYQLQTVCCCARGDMLYKSVHQVNNRNFQVKWKKLTVCDVCYICGWTMLIHMNGKTQIQNVSK